MFTTYSRAEWRVKQLRAIAERHGHRLALHQAREIIATAGNYNGWHHLKGMLAEGFGPELELAAYEDRLRIALRPLVGEATDGIIAGLTPANDAATTATMFLHESGDAFWAGRSRSEIDPSSWIHEFTKGSDPIVEFRHNDRPHESELFKLSIHSGQPCFMPAITKPGMNIEVLRHPVLKRLRRLNGSSLRCCWSDPEYREVCEIIRFPPDFRRPRIWRLSDVDVKALGIAQIALATEHYRISTAIAVERLITHGLQVVCGYKIHLSDLTRTRHLARAMLERRNLEVSRGASSSLKVNVDELRALGLDLALLDRLCGAILARETPMVEAFALVDFLPSPDGHGANSRINGGCDPDRGWHVDVGSYISQSYPRI